MIIPLGLRLLPRDDHKSTANVDIEVIEASGLCGVAAKASWKLSQGIGMDHCGTSAANCPLSAKGREMIPPHHTPQGCDGRPKAVRRRSPMLGVVDSKDRSL